MTTTYTITIQKSEGDTVICSDSCQVATLESAREALEQLHKHIHAFTPAE